MKSINNNQVFHNVSTSQIGQLKSSGNTINNYNTKHLELRPKQIMIDKISKKVKTCFENDLLSTHNFVPEGSVLKIQAAVS